MRLVSVGSHAPKEGLYETEMEGDEKLLRSGVRVKCYDPYIKKWYAEDFFREEEKKELAGCLVDVLPNGDHFWERTEISPPGLGFLAILI